MAVPVLALMLTACNDPPPASTSAAEVEGNTVAIQTWPPMTLEVAPEFQHIGSTDFILYGVANADVHVFVDADPSGVVERLYWIQIEAYLESNNHQYDYSRMPYRRGLGETEFLADIRYGDAFSLEEADPESDVAQVVGLVLENGYRMPETMIRSRMVLLDEERRRELLIIYMESRDEIEPGPTEFEASPEVWEEEIPRFLDRAASGIRVVSASD